MPEPPEPSLAAADELPEAVEQRRQRYMPEGEEKYRSVTLVQRNMEQARGPMTSSPCCGWSTRAALR